jgi:hypothetical protein
MPSSRSPTAVINFVVGSSGWRALQIRVDRFDWTITIQILPSRHNGSVGLKSTSPDTWDGYVYNPQDGKTYSGNITILSNKALKVVAYIGLPIFGRSQTWTRVNSPAANEIEYNCRRTAAVP